MFAAVCGGTISLMIFYTECVFCFIDPYADMIMADGISTLCNDLQVSPALKLIIIEVTMVPVIYICYRSKVVEQVLVAAWILWPLRIKVFVVV